MTKPELLAPAGSWECVKSAVANGADAIFFGLPKLNARIRADNFTEEDLPELIRYVHDRGVKAYVTLNTLVFANELPEAERFLILLHKAGVDAAIVQDLGLVELARSVVPDLHIHASTQMTLTSPEGLQFAKKLGIKRAVLARELSLRELEKFKKENTLPMEVFVHGALCVAYSGQCLTSESLGQRSANRGECAQACRLPYQLIVDDVVRDLGDRRYLLSPQDLAAVDEIPKLIELGIECFKIEGRLKSAEYVAAVCQVYRKAIDAAWNDLTLTNPDESTKTLDTTKPDASDRYKLEMTFSRGLYSGWLHGVNHQKLVHARFGTKRGPFVGFINSIGDDYVEIEPATDSNPSENHDHPEEMGKHPSQNEVTLSPGDGIVFDTGGNTDHEQGGRIYQIKNGRLYFEYGRIHFDRIKVGDRVWKTSDPKLERELQKSFKQDALPTTKPLNFKVEGSVGKPLKIIATLESLKSLEPLSSVDSLNPLESPKPLNSIVPADSKDRRLQVETKSEVLLQSADKHPLSTEILKDKLGKLGGTPFHLGQIENRITDNVILPLSELNRLKRDLVEQLIPLLNTESKPERVIESKLQSILSNITMGPKSRKSFDADQRPIGGPILIPLCRNTAQLEAALEFGSKTIYVDFEDIRKYKEAVARVRMQDGVEVYLATPRIQKAGEQGFFKVIEAASPDGVLIRNIGALSYFNESALKKVGDFSLNVANAITASVLMNEGLQHLTVSYDLNFDQVMGLIKQSKPYWFELTLHQHMPMFHMEHCVYAAFLSQGTDHTNCGRPCDHHQIKLRDRVGAEHPVKADVGCRNTVFHQKAQSGANFIHAFLDAGLRTFRVELLNESAEQTLTILQTYQALLNRDVSAETLINRLRVQNQLGVTNGTLTVLGTR